MFWGKRGTPTALQMKILLAILAYCVCNKPVKGCALTILGDAPIKVQQDRKKLAEGHFNYQYLDNEQSLTRKLRTDLGRGAAPELKSVEFLSETLFVVE